MERFDNLSLITALTESNADDLARLPAFLRTLLVADGTVTRSLEAFFWEPIDVLQLGQGMVELDRELAPLVLPAGAQALRREVELRGRETQVLYSTAESFINIDAVPAPWRERLSQGRLGIGTLISDSGMESYREIINFDFTSSGTVARTYLILLDQRPAIQITERFPLSAF